MNHALTIRPHLHLLGLLIIISVLLPPTRVFFTFKPDLPLTFLAALLLLNEKKIDKLAIVTWYKVLGLILLVWMFVSGNYGNLRFGLSNTAFVIPTEYMQIFSRVTVFYVFAYIGYKQVISSKRFFTYVTVTFLLSLVFALLQVFQISFINELSVRAYALSGTQKHVFQNNVRIFGTIGNAITWGGFSGLIFFYFYFLVDHRGIKTTGCLLSIISIVFSSSRAAVFAFIITIVIVGLISVFYKSGKGIFLRFFKRVILMTASAVGVVLLALIFIPSRLFSILLRINNTESDLTERGRGAQLSSFLELFSENADLFIFGIGKKTLDQIDYMEIEPFFLLFAYGVFGFTLHYLFVAILVKKVHTLRKHNLNYFLFIISTSLFYLIFSFGFFFFREIISGLPFWWLCGYLIGVMYRMKHQSIQLSTS